MISLLYTLIIWSFGFTTLTLALGWWMNGYFRRRGVKSPPAYLPLVGHMTDSLLQRKHLRDFLSEAYNLYPNERYYGVLQFRRPIIVLKDLELIKQLTIKDFDHFIDHISNLSEDANFAFGSNLFSLRGQKWRDMRATLSPAFTSAKMRGMFQFVVECGEQMADYYLKQMCIEENKVRGLIELEMKDAFTRYANDVIATNAFGLKVNSFIDKENEFYLKGKEVTDFSGLKLLKLSFLAFLPKVAQLLNLQFFSTELVNFFRRLVWDTIKDREERNIVRNDMIQLLMEARKGTLKHESNEDDKDTGFATVEESAVGKTVVKRVWTDDDIVAQAVLFLIAGFDTSSTLLCFLAHELTIHPEIQRKLQKEIDEIHTSVDGKINYDCLQKMKYMDMVVSETLRLWPPIAVIDRMCKKPYTIPPPNENGKEFHMEETNGIWVPVYALHHDPKYFPNPGVFDPERFSDENKDKIQPFSYLPFGVGPRNCIGSRFALIEAKAAIYNLLLKFDLVSTAKTQNPIQLKLNTIHMQSKNGFWVGLKPRVQSK